MNIYFFVGLLLALAGSVGIYLASPHQRWLVQPWAAQPTRSISSLLLLASLWILVQTVSTLVAVFALLHWVMLLWVVFPYLGGLFTLKRGAA